MDEDKVNELVVFLSNPNRKAEQHVDTVMEMVRELSKYKHELAETRKNRDQLSDMLRASSNDGMGFMEHQRRRDYDPQRMQIPANARSVEVKF
jgi:hypothetical protein